MCVFLRLFDVLFHFDLSFRGSWVLVGFGRNSYISPWTWVRLCLSLTKEMTLWKSTFLFHSTNVKKLKSLRSICICKLYRSEFSAALCRRFVYQRLNLDIITKIDLTMIFLSICYILWLFCDFWGWCIILQFNALFYVCNY